MMMGIMMKATSNNIFRDKSVSNPNVIKKIHQGKIGHLVDGKFAELKTMKKSIAVRRSFVYSVVLICTRKILIYIRDRVVQLKAEVV